MLVILALRNIYRNRARSGITLLTIAAGCAAIILGGGFIEFTGRGLTESYINDFIGHLRIYAPGFSEHARLEPFDFMISQPQQILRELILFPEVSYAAPRLSFSGLIGNGDTTLSFVGEGIDPAIETPERTQATLESGTFLKDPKGYDIWLGKGLAKALAAKPGDALVVVTNTKRGAINATDAQVRGIFSTADKPYDDRAARLPLAVVQKLLKTKDVETILVFLRDTAQTASVKSRLEERFRAAGLSYEVKAWYELEEAEFVLKSKAFFGRLFLFLQTMIVLVVLLGVINTMNMAVLERIGEIGTMMAIGTTRRQVAALFILEGFFLGFLGGALGAAGGCMLALVVSHFGIPMPSPPGSTITFVARISVVPPLVFATWAVAAITALVSALLPAIKASRSDIGDALRHNI